MNKKTCIMCGESRPLDEYYDAPRMLDGKMGRCKACHRSEIRRVRHENIDRYRAYDRARSKLPGRKAKHRLKNQKKRLLSGPLYDKAHNDLARAIASGKVVRPDHCQRCLVQCSPQAHHDDYSKSFNVMFLCPICHAQRHKELGRLNVVDAPLTEIK